jgi:DNA invertase Pin-like site-specific DNA recombinase
MGGKPMRVATYARIDVRSHRLAATLERRQERLATYVASRQGWEHVASYSDGGRHGGPELRRLLDDAAAGRFDLVVVHDLEELAGNWRSRRAVVARLGRAGVRVHTLHTARRAALVGLADLAFVDWLWEGPR